MTEGDPVSIKRALLPVRKRLRHRRIVVPKLQIPVGLAGEPHDQPSQAHARFPTDIAVLWQFTDVNIVSWRLFAPASISLRMSAIRELAAEAPRTDCSIATGFRGSCL